MPTFAEFFAGGGMVRAGLGQAWTCVFANDIDPKKSKTYRENWGAEGHLLDDVANINSSAIPGCVDLAWASFPCQDLSLAGMGAGLHGGRSGTFWSFWSIIRQLRQEGRNPGIIALENVVGALSTHGGSDFRAICSAIVEEGYSLGALVLDAADFVPQSRPRLFIVAVDERYPIKAALFSDGPGYGHPQNLVKAFNQLEFSVQSHWKWWNISAPTKAPIRLINLMELENHDWFDQDKTEQLLCMMSTTNRHKLKQAQRLNEAIVGTIYKRTRTGTDGSKVQRAEVRFDQIAGCLRTPSGGSSRQIVIYVNGKDIKARLISARETARLMGLPDSYRLPYKYNEAYHLTGDGVVVPVVRMLANQLFEPIVQSARKATIAAA